MAAPEVGICITTSGPAKSEFVFAPIQGKVAKSLPA